MQFDIFLSICHTPVGGHLPSEAEMFQNFFAQLEAADALGFGTAWVAQAHLSTEVQKRNRQPVVPHWEGEVGLCTDFFQLAHACFARTERIEVGSAVMSLLTHGGPVGIAERVGAFLALHGLDPVEKRRLRIGFSAGRFEFMARPYGIVPRDSVEQAAWPALRGQIFAEACEIFLRLLNGEVLSSETVRRTVLSRENFRSDGDWGAVQQAAVKRDALTAAPDEIPIPNRYEFEELKTIPQEWRQELLDLVLGSHDPPLQVACNQWRPVKTFNLSITPPAVIDATHARMRDCYHLDGGPWQRHYMPRTVFVFLNEEPGLTAAERAAAAHAEARQALGSYWGALEGTIDPMKVASAADNAVIGNADEVAQQLAECFDSKDCVMAWFDFFNHDSERVVRNMEAFMQKVAPQVAGLQ
ncbi:MAG: LLM class flavin-dependent oxidoreductase [Candidatus Poseidoniia archaeon]|nr:LLM class flavin-dependent oxidoreductase [Candidatus Poseidoniia archaeon]